MDDYVDEHQRLPNHANFKHLFEFYTSGISDRLTVRREVKITDYDGNEAIEIAQLEAMVRSKSSTSIAAARSRRTQAWYSALRPWFIPRQTLLVMQDWRLHRELPPKWFNQTLAIHREQGRRIDVDSRSERRRNSKHLPFRQASAFQEKRIMFRSRSAVGDVLLGARSFRLSSRATPLRATRERGDQGQLHPNPSHGQGRRGLAAIRN